LNPICLTVLLLDPIRLSVPHLDPVSVADWPGRALENPRVGPWWVGGTWSLGSPAYRDFVSRRSTTVRDFVWAATIASTDSAWATD